MKGPGFFLYIMKIICCMFPGTSGHWHNMETNTRNDPMECPHCKNELVLPSHVYMNCQTYQQVATATTQCCQQLVRVTPITSFNVSKYTGGKTHDDWGVPAKRENDE